MRRRCSLIVVLLILALVAGAFGQRWHSFYQEGLKAIGEERWDDAIANLTQAIEKDDSPSRFKIIEGVYGIEYFPFLYLGLAYLRKGDLGQAEAYFERAAAHGSLTDEMRQNLTDYRAEVQSLQAAQQVAESDQPEVTQPPPSVDPRFEVLVQQARNQISTKDYVAAIESLEAARELESEEFASRNLVVDLQDARNSLRSAQNLLIEGRQLANEGRLDSALEQLTAASELMPSLQGVAGARNTVVERVNQYEQLKELGRSNFDQGDFESAYTNIAEARELYIEAAERDGLGDLLTEISSRRDVSRLFESAVAAFREERFGEAADAFRTVLDRQPGYPEAEKYLNRASSVLDRQAGQQFEEAGDYEKAEESYRKAVVADRENSLAVAGLRRLQEFRSRVERARTQEAAKDYSTALQELTRARSVDPTRFQKEGLNSFLVQIRDAAKPPDASEEKPSRPIAEIRRGIFALFEGEVDDSISTLGELAERDNSDAVVLAYLGLAYATKSLLMQDDEGSTRFHEQAGQYFAESIRVDPSFEFPPHLVSPRIREFFEEVRATRQ